MAYDYVISRDELKQEIEISFGNSEDAKVFDAILDEHNIPVIMKKWQSKYNSYIVYDYEPFCSEGFNVEFTLPATARAEFCLYLLDKRIESIDKLERSFKKIVKLKLKD